MARGFLLAALTLSAGCGEKAAPAPIWLGHVANLSGPDKHVGEAAARGIRLAVEEINKDFEQGVGRPFKVIHSDTRGKLEAFEAEAVRLAAINRVSFLLGGATPDEVERLDRSGVPILSPCGAATRTTSETVFWTGLPPVQRGKILAQFAALELGTASMVIVSDERRDDCVASAEAFAREFPLAWTKKDAKVSPVIRRFRWPKDTKASEWAPALRKEIADGGCKAILFAGQKSALRELGLLPLPVYFAGDTGDGPALAELRAQGQELFYLTPFVADADGEGAAPRAVEFAKRYQQAFQEVADEHAALAYEEVKLLQEAMVRTKDSLKLPRILEELTKLKDVPGLTGPLSFTPERQLRRPAFVIRIDDGGVKTMKKYNPEG